MAFVRKNFARATLASSLNASVTQMTVLSGHTLPTEAGTFRLTIWNVTNFPDPFDDPGLEIVTAEYSGTPNVYTVIRAQEDTSDQDHSAGERAALHYTAGMSEDDIYDSSDFTADFATKTLDDLAAGVANVHLTTVLKSNYDTAYGWGNHSGLYDLLGTASGLVSNHESTYNHVNYNTAYSHSQLGSGNPHNVTPTELGLVIGTDVQAFGEVLDDLNILGAVASDGQFIVGTGAGIFAYESGNTARTSLGLGTGNTPQFAKVGVGAASVAAAMNYIYQAQDEGDAIPGIVIAGYEYYISGDGQSADGVAILCGVNRSGNRQLWITESDSVGSATRSTFRMLSGDRISRIDSLTADGVTGLPMQFGTSTQPIIISNHGGEPAYNATMPGQLSIYSRDGTAGVVIIENPSTDQLLLDLRAYSGDLTGGASLFSVGQSGNVTIANGGTIGQAAGPLLTFNDTDNYLGITGVDRTGIGTVAPEYFMHMEDNVDGPTVCLLKNSDDGAGAYVSWNLHVDTSAFVAYKFGSNYATSNQYIALTALLEDNGAVGMGYSVTNAGAAHKFYVGGNNVKLTVDSDGVTIGTLSGILKGTNGLVSAITDNSANWDTAYSHSQLVEGNPHSVTPSELSLVIGTDTQAWDASLDSIATLTYASPSFIKLTAEDTYAVRTIAETKEDLALNLVENTALSTWSGTTNITTLGTITTVGDITIANGGTIGCAGAPILTFDDTNNYLLMNDAILNLTGVGVSLPFVAFTPSTSYGQFVIKDASHGGLQITGLTDSDEECVTIRGYTGATTVVSSVFYFSANKSNGGTGFAALAAGEPVFKLENRGTQLMLIAGNGDTDVKGDVNVGGSLYITEKAAADADVAGKGQIWVKSDTPNTLWFTDDTGTDIQLGTAGSLDYTDVSANDGDTDVTGLELEELTDGSVTALHSHAGGGGGDTYTDRGDPAAADYTQASLTRDGNWNTLDLSGIVTAGATAVRLYVDIVHATTARWIWFRKNGNSNTQNTEVMQTQVSNIAMRDNKTVFCDANRVIEYRAHPDFNASGTIQITVCGWYI